MESKLSKNTQSDHQELSKSLEKWKIGLKWRHPILQENFYRKLEAPLNKEDAQSKLKCHKEAVEDFILQLRMIECEMDLLIDTDTNEVIPYRTAEYEECQHKKLKLLQGQRFNQNASSAYSYYLEKLENKV
tara:strand:- start:1440 stop:1832 length:393 start_codon:yes stop_codon:yes gene_type:complete